MACSTKPYCLGVWTDARCTPCAVTTLSATPKPAQHCLQRPRPILYRARRWAVSPRVALPWRQRSGQRRHTAWACEGAPNAARLQFLLSGLLPLSRSTTSKTVVAPISWAAGLSPWVALPSSPSPAQRRRTAEASGQMPDAPRVLSRPSLLPPSPRSTACNTRGPSCTERGAAWAVSPS